MNLMNRQRGFGSTTMLLSAANVQKIPLIVANCHHKELAIEEAEALGYDVMVFTANEFVDNRLGSQYSNVLIDDVELVIGEALKQYFGTNIYAATMSVPMTDHKA